jgi:hypothetical protein
MKKNLIVDFMKLEVKNLIHSAALHSFATLAALFEEGLKDSRHATSHPVGYFSNLQKPINN